MDATTFYVIIAVLAVLVVGFLVMRPRGPRQVERKAEGEPYVARTDRPYVKPAPPPPAPAEGEGVAGELAAAAADVSGEVLGVDAHGALSGDAANADDLKKLKGVGPKMVAKLNELGIYRFEQLAKLSANEVAHLDERMGPFKGRLARDRVVEQAGYLARGDIDGFEEKFGKLGG
jgi:predicted flap endonuclease-1-like 5' DNA nuclease